MVGRYAQHPKKLFSYMMPRSTSKYPSIFLPLEKKVKEKIDYRISNAKDPEKRKVGGFNSVRLCRITCDYYKPSIQLSYQQFITNLAYIQSFIHQFKIVFMRVPGLDSFNNNVYSSCQLLNISIQFPTKGNIYELNQSSNSK